MGGHEVSDSVFRSALDETQTKQPDPLPDTDAPTL